MDSDYKTKEKLPLKGIVPDADFPVIFAEKGILQFDLVFKESFVEREMIAVANDIPRS